MDNNSIYEDQFCEVCGNEISGDEADTYFGMCKHCYDNQEDE